MTWDPTKNLAATYDFTAASPVVTLGDGAGSPTLVLDKAPAGTSNLTFSRNAGTIDWQFRCEATEVLSLRRYSAGSFVEDSVSIDDATGDIDLGTGAVAKTITIGNTTGATAVNYDAGSGDHNFAGDVNITDASAIVAIGDGTGGPQLKIQKSDAGASSIRFMNEETGQQRRFQIGLNGNEVISLSGYDTSGNLIEDFLEYAPSTKEIKLGNDAETGEIKIGAGAAGRTITIGNTTGTTAIELDAGTGGINANVPVTMASYTVAGVPTAVAGGVIYVTDETGGAVLAFSDGTNWRRCTDRAIVS